MPSHNSGGANNVTIVNGSTRVGAHAVDGSLNVVQSAGSTFTGLRHPSGAMYVVPTSTPKLAIQHPSGALYVSTNNSIGTRRVNAVSGSFV